MTDEERSNYFANIENAKKTHDKVKAETQTAAKERAQLIWHKAKPANKNHPYLSKKNVMPYNIREDDEGRLIIPIRNANAEIQVCSLSLKMVINNFLKTKQLMDIISL